jgi:tousled-like kinase
MREEEEILKVRYSSLKKQEYELFALHESLLREKEIHLKEIRRVRDENASRFHSHPLMNNRYLLIRLIGKGGFSEVYLVSLYGIICKVAQFLKLYGIRHLIWLNFGKLLARFIS